MMANSIIHMNFIAATNCIIVAHMISHTMILKLLLSYAIPHTKMLLLQYEVRK